MDFKHLQVWRRAHALAIELHKLASHFTRSGHANLRSQLTRAADSIATNIAESCGAESRKEMARFFEISIKSANETENHLISARDLGLITKDQWQVHDAELIAVRKMAYVYRRRILESNALTRDSAV